MRLQNYVCGNWVEGTGPATDLVHAVTGEKVAASSGGIDFKAMAQYARSVGGPALRRSTFHERACMLKAMAQYLTERKDAYYQVSAATGATKADSWIDIDGGFGTLFVYASKGRREFPNETFYVDGGVEGISKAARLSDGTSACPSRAWPCTSMRSTSRLGDAREACLSLLAGVLLHREARHAHELLTERVFRDIIASGIFPEGTVQPICGSAGDLLDHLDSQDAVAFTGSATTGRSRRSIRRWLATPSASTWRPTRQLLRARPRCHAWHGGVRHPVKEVSREMTSGRRGRSVPPCAERSCPKRWSRTSSRRCRSDWRV
ncbi:MAG: hypothetical protein U0163_20835 [Gemmatimonadaceae bacterium]